MLGTARVRFAAVAAAATAATALASWTLPATEVMAAPPTSTQRTVVNNGHTDAVDVRYVDGDLQLKTRIGNSGNYVEADPSEVIFQLFDNEHSKVAVPDDPAFSFLGPVGAPMWVAPETQVEGLVWPGWNTESLPGGLFTDNAVDLHLREVHGPEGGRSKCSRTTRSASPFAPSARSTPRTVRCTNRCIPTYTPTGSFPRWVATP